MVKRRKNNNRKSSNNRWFNGNGVEARKINASMKFDTCTERLCPFGGLLALIRFLVWSIFEKFSTLPIKRHPANPSWGTVISDSKVGVGGRVVRIEPNGLFVCSGRILMAAKIVISEARVEVGGRVIRFDLNGLPVCYDCFFEAAKATISDPRRKWAALFESIRMACLKALIASSRRSSL